MSLDKKLSELELKKRALAVNKSCGNIFPSDAFNNGFIHFLNATLRGAQQNVVQNYLAQFLGRIKGEPEDYLPDGDRFATGLAELATTPIFSPERVYSSTQLEMTLAEMFKVFKYQVHLSGVVVVDKLEDLKYEGEGSDKNPNGNNKEFSKARVNAFGFVRTFLANDPKKWEVVSSFASAVQDTAPRGAIYSPLSNARRNSNLNGLYYALSLLIPKEIFDKEYPLGNPLKELFDISKAGLFFAGINQYNEALIWHPEPIRKKAA